MNWLWRYGEGPIDWEEIMDSIGDTDVVLTAPDCEGNIANKQDLDYQHNNEFAARLANDPLVARPIHLKLGQFEHVDVVVFVDRNYNAKVP